MTLTEILQAVEQLTPDELDTLTEFVQRKRKKHPNTPMTDSELKARLDNIFADAVPVEVKASTLKFDEFMHGIDLMRQDLSQIELDNIAEAIETETPPSDETSHD